MCSNYLALLPSALLFMEYFSCRGVVPLWNKYWDRALSQAAKTKKDLSILATLGRERVSFLATLGRVRVSFLATLGRERGSFLATLGR